MLSFTTYHIPEHTKNQTQVSGKWLFFLLNEAITEEKTALLVKIAAALKADMDEHVTIHQVTSPASFQDIIGNNLSLVISFGVPTHQFGLRIDLSEPGLRLMEKHACILTSTLTELEKQSPNKKALWRDMQLYLSTRTHE